LYRLLQWPLLCLQALPLTATAYDYHQWSCGNELPKGKALRHSINSKNEDAWSIKVTGWTDVSGHCSALSFFAARVCAVAIHRDELAFTEEDSESRLCPHHSRLRVSGYVVSASHFSPLKPGLRV
jgi:hypothetical protein